jgi:thymidylate synthase
MVWPRYQTANVMVPDLHGHLGIVTLWTPRQRVASLIGATEGIAAIGNLYAMDGINWVIRNLLEHPTISHLVILGKDLTGTGQALLDLVHQGAPDRTIPGTTIPLTPEIPEEVLANLLHGLIALDYRTLPLADLSREYLTWKTLQYATYRRRPQQFPLIPPTTTIFPTEIGNHRIVADSLESAYRALVQEVLRFGQLGPTTYGETQKELLYAHVTIHDPDWTHPAPYADPMALRYQRDSIVANQPVEDVTYTYGDRLRMSGQLDTVRYMLTETPDTRQAYCTLWLPEDLGTTAPPCWVSAQWCLREGLLHGMVVFRSHDVFKAWYTNMLAIAEVHAMLADQLGVPMGPLYATAHSAHIYESDWVPAQLFLDTPQRLRPERQMRDPQGSFVITIWNHMIEVLHYSPSGQYLQSWTGDSAADFTAILAQWVSRPAHLIYLGTELAKAEYCLVTKRPYQQDQFTFWDLDQE